MQARLCAGKRCAGMGFQKSFKALSDPIRRDILALKQECERVEHGGWTAVIFGKLVAQRIFHRGTFFRVAYSYRITI